MKKFFAVLLVFLAAINADAQFTEGTKYLGTSLTNLGMSYNTKSKFRFGLTAEGGYFFADNFMARAYAGYEHQKDVDNFNIGAGLRYHILQNGLFLGAGVEYAHFSPKANDFLIPVEIGYTFYLNHYLAVEPAVYYKMSTNDFSDGSTVGLKVGLGFYF